MFLEFWFIGWVSCTYGLCAHVCTSVHMHVEKGTTGIMWQFLGIFIKDIWCLHLLQLLSLSLAAQCADSAP